MKKLTILCLSVASSLMLSLGVACAQKPILSGFDVEEAITVAYGETYAFPPMLVKDNQGNYYEVTTEVFDSDNNKVPVYSGAFTINSIGNYRIVYTVNGNGVKETKTTTITVDASGVSFIKASSEKLVEIGETVAVDLQKESGYTYEITAVHNDTDASLAVSNNGTFVPEQSGLHTVTVTATSVVGETSDYSWTVYVRPEMKEGEIETFDESWKYVAEYGEDARAKTWDITSTAETGVKDRFGLDSTYAVLDTAKLANTSEYANQGRIFLGMGIRGEKKYYKNLAKNEDYKYVSFWMYIDSPSDTTYQTYLCMNEVTFASYTTDKGKLPSNEWVQVKMLLRAEAYDGMVDYKGSFVDSYDIFQDGSARPILIVDEAKNADLKIYLADIYAVKDVAVETVDTANKQPSVDDTVQFADYFGGDYDLQYTLSYNGETIATNGESHTFTRNGEYTLTAQTTKAQQYANGSASVTLSVQDVNTLSFDPLIKEKTENSLAVNFSELNATLTKNDVAVAGATASYSVSFLNQPVDSTANGFTATVDGCYEVEIDFTYEKNGTEYHSIHTATVDVWSTANKYAIVPVGEEYINTSMVAATGYLNRSWSPMPTTEIVSVVDGVNGKFYKTVSSAQYHDIYFRPIYSKHYYEQLLANDSSLMVSLRHFSDDISDEYNVVGSSKRDYTALGVTQNGKEMGGWTDVTVSLSDFLNVQKTYTYEYFTNGVLWINEMLASGKQNESNKTQGRAIRFGSTSSFYTEVSFDGVWLMSQSSATPVVTTNGNVVVGQENNLLDLLSVTLDGNTANISSIAVNFNGEKVNLIGGIFKPSFAGSYKLDIRATYANANGAKVYKDFTYTITTTGTPLTVDEIQLTQENAEVNLWALQNKPAGYGDNYDFTYVVYRHVGSTTSELASGEVTQTTTFDFADYVTSGIGSFEIVYILSEQGNTSTFATIEFHKVTVDVVADDTQAVYQNYASENFSDYYTLWNWSQKVSLENSAEVKGGNLVIKSDAERAEIQIMPLYSKAYYEKLKNQGYSIIFDWKIELAEDWSSTEDTITQPDALTVNLYSKSWNDAKYNYRAPIGKWQTFSVSLEDFLANWDIVNKTSGSAKSTWQRSFLTVQNGVHRVDGVAYRNGEFTLTMTDILVVKAVEATEYTLTATGIEEGVAYDMNNAVVTLDGHTATDVTYEVDEATGIKIENGKLTAAFGGNYDITVKASVIVGTTKYNKTFTTKISVNGSNYTVISETVPKVFTVDEVASGYDLKAVFQAGGINALESGDVFAYKVYTINGEEKTLNNTTVTNGVIALNALAQGKYYVEVLVVRGTATLRLYSGYFSIIDSVNTYLANGGNIMTFDSDWLASFNALNVGNYNYALGANEKPTIVTGDVTDKANVTKANVLKIKRYWDGKAYVLMKSDFDIDVLYYFQQHGYSLQFDIYYDMPNTANWKNVAMQTSGNVWFNAKSNVWYTGTINIDNYIATYNATSPSAEAYTFEMRTTTFASTEGSSYCYITPLRLVAPTA